MLSHLCRVLLSVKVNILWSTIVLRMLLSIFYCHHIAQHDAHTESERHIKQNKVDSDNTPPPGLASRNSRPHHGGETPWASRYENVRLRGTFVTFLTLYRPHRGETPPWTESVTVTPWTVVRLVDC